jgi:hypothetical protein
VGLRQGARELESLTWEVLLKQPAWWVTQLNQAESDLPKCKDPAAAQRCVTQGRRAVEGDDLEGLQAAVRQLWGMMTTQQATAGTSLGGAARGDTRKKDL